jgi:large subunit ribosomal protein L34
MLRAALAGRAAAGGAGRRAAAAAGADALRARGLAGMRPAVMRPAQDAPAVAQVGEMLRLLALGERRDPIEKLVGVEVNHATNQQVETLPANPQVDLIFEAIKREYQPNFLRRKRNHGFLKRIRKKAGRKVVSRRRERGRRRLAAT